MKLTAIVVLSLCSAAVGFLFAEPAFAQAQLEQFNLKIDKTTRSQGRTRSKPPDQAARNLFVAQIERLAKASSTICLDLKVELDGKTRFSVLRSAEEDFPDQPRRDNVDCGPNAYGRLPMGPGMEYYIMTEGINKPRTALAIFPGSRTTHVINDVACVFDQNRDTATVRIRGLYRRLTNRYLDSQGNVVSELQLRPLVPAREEMDRCQIFD